MDSMIVDEFRRIKVLLNVVRIPEDIKQLRTMTELANEASKSIQERHELKTALQMRKSDEEKLKQTTSSPLVEYTDEEINKLASKLRDEKIEALEELQDRVLKIDNSNAFVKYQGRLALYESLQSDDVEIRQLSTALATIVVQNNSYAQDDFIGSSLYYAIIDILTFEPPGYQPTGTKRTIPMTPRTTMGYSLAKSALFFLRALLENNTKAQQSFIQSGSLQAVINVINLLASELETELVKKSESRAAVGSVVRAAFGVLSLLLESTPKTPSIDITTYFKKHYGEDSDISSAYESITKGNGDVTRVGHMKDELAARYTMFIMNVASSPRNEFKENALAESATKASTATATTTTTTTATTTTEDESITPVTSTPTSTQFINALVEVESTDTSNESDATPLERDSPTQKLTNTINIPISSIIREAVAKYLDFGALTIMIQYADHLGRQQAQNFTFNYILSASPSSTSYLVKPSEKFRSSLSPQIGNISIDLRILNNKIALQTHLRSALVQRFQNIEAEIKADPSLKEESQDELALIASTIRVYDDLLSGKKMTADEFISEIQ